MFRLPTIAACLAVAGALPLPAAAQTVDCIATGLVSVEAIDRGTQRVPRDPRSVRDLMTVSASIRNVSTRQLVIQATFQAPPVSQEFVSGQSWTLAPGNRASLVLGNVFKTTVDSVVRSTLKLSCS